MVILHLHRLQAGIQSLPISFPQQEKKSIAFWALLPYGMYLLVSLPLLLTWPFPVIDEAVFAETARNLLTSGTLASGFVEGM
jgi:hypothetical protein